MSCLKKLTLRNYLVAIAVFYLAGCVDDNTKTSDTVKMGEDKPATSGPRQFAGTFSNGMKGDSIFFNISVDGRKLENLTIKGYWRCNGTLEQTTVGPEGAFDVSNNKVNGHITEPPDGGSTAWRFELQANIDAGKASGSFRMNINNLGCDT